MNRKSTVFSLIIGFMIFFTGCVSKPHFSGKGDMCGMILDENNKPISDFIIYCNSGPLFFGAASTNAEGIFVFHDVSAGEYSLYGEKNGFVKMKKTGYFFNDRTKLFCCQLISASTAFCKIDKYLKNGEIENAAELVEKICFEKDSVLASVVISYQIYLLSFDTNKNKNKKKIEKFIKRLRELKSIDCKNYADEMEEKLL